MELRLFYSSLLVPILFLPFISPSEIGSSLASSPDTTTVANEPPSLGQHAIFDSIHPLSGTIQSSPLEIGLKDVPRSKRTVEKSSFDSLWKDLEAQSKAADEDAVMKKLMVQAIEEAVRRKEKERDEADREHSRERDKAWNLEFEAKRKEGEEWKNIRKQMIIIQDAENNRTYLQESADYMKHIISKRPQTIKEYEHLELMMSEAHAREEEMVAALRSVAGDSAEILAALWKAEADLVYQKHEYASSTDSCNLHANYVASAKLKVREFANVTEKAKKMTRPKIRFSELYSEKWRLAEKITHPSMNDLLYSEEHQIQYLANLTAQLNTATMTRDDLQREVEEGLVRGPPADSIEPRRLAAAARAASDLAWKTKCRIDGEIALLKKALPFAQAEYTTAKKKAAALSEKDQFGYCNLMRLEIVTG